MKPPTLAVDLDGTLVYTDTLHESVLMLIKRHPLAMFALPFWLMRGKAYMKRRLSYLVTPDLTLLPYNTDLVNWLREQHGADRELVLCTAADQKIADGKVAVALFIAQIGSALREFIFLLVVAVVLGA